ncbi:MAG TPA: copper resistance protein CopC [Acidimicrobiia bacterium]
MTSTIGVRRLLALGALVVALLAVFAAPASAHASLLSTDPSTGGVYDTPPKAVTLRFSEGVEVSLGGVRVYTGDRQRVVTGKPEHPNGQQSVVATSLPNLDDGTYVVTWRVVSADSHPIEGAYTFQVGSKATLSDKNAKNAAASLLATTGGSRTVGVVYAIDRAVLYAGIALLLGGAVFLAVVWRAGRDDRRAKWLVWSGWIAVFVTTAFGIALEGVYAAGLPLDDVFDTSVLRDVIDTRYGKVALVRLALLVLAIPLLRLLLHRRPQAEHPLRWWWMLSGLVVGAGIAVTPGIAGHASTGIQTGLAIPADLVHVAGMACWLGGLVVLCVAVLPRRDVDELRAVLPRYSALALGAIVALVVSGAYQAWRQVGSFDELKTTDYGKLLIAKLVAFAALIVAAAFSREVVNRRFRELPPDDEEFVSADDPVLVGAGGPPTIGGATGSAAGTGRSAGHGGYDDGYDDGYDAWDDDAEDQEEMTRLRRSVWVEVAIAVVILAITAMLVNAAPARAQSSGPVSLVLKSNQVWVYADVAPGVVGPNDMHFTALPTGGGPANIADMTVQLTRPGEDLPPFTVPLQKLSAGHYYAPLYDIPYSGKWQMTVRVQLGQTDEAVLTSPFNIR